MDLMGGRLAAIQPIFMAAPRPRWEGDISQALSGFLPKSPFDKSGAFGIIISWKYRSVSLKEICMAIEEFPRMKRLPPYVFATVNALKMMARRRGEDIIDLGMGNPDLPTPQHIVDNLIEAAGKGANHRYSASTGITKLRVALSDWYKRPFYVDIDPER